MRTSFYDIHKSLDAKIVNFHGWEMPLQYTGIMDEHVNVRTNVGLFDVSHMGRFEIKGQHSLAFLQELVTNDLEKLRDHQALYSPMCYEDGGIGHNIETVARLSPLIRDSRATYKQSLRVLEMIKDIDYKIYTKSSMMLGLGEMEEEVMQAAKDLRSAGVDMVSIGQYLQPTSRHVPVKEYITPEKFDSYRKSIEKMGFAYTVAGPFVRSSYKAGELFMKNMVYSRQRSNNNNNNNSNSNSSSYPKQD